MNDDRLEFDLSPDEKQAVIVLVLIVGVVGFLLGLLTGILLY